MAACTKGATVKVAGAVVTGCILIVVVCNAISGDNRNAWNPTPVRLDNITAKKVAALFDKIYDYGFAENKNRSLKNQFLVVFLASLSDMEVEVHKWETLPMNFSNHSAERTLFLLNNSTCSNDPKHALHGEVIAIDYGHIDRMVSDFVADRREQGKEEWPLVFMYSWYIPCSKIADIGYSCAEELMNYARNRKDKLGVVVAYSHVYRDTWCNTGRQTNETYSRLAMEDGGLVAFNRRDQGNYEQTVNYSAPRILEPNVSTFQYEFYSCLLSSKVAACCSVQASDQPKLVSFYTNNLTYRCTSTSRKSGLFTEGGKTELKRCMKTIVLENARENCHEQISEDESHFSWADKSMLHGTCSIDLSAHRNCLDSALNISMWSMLPGKPYPINDPYSGEWTPFEGPWKDLYHQTPMFDVNNNPILCEGEKSSKMAPLCPATRDVEEHGPAVKVLVVTVVLGAAIKGVNSISDRIDGC